MKTDYEIEERIKKHTNCCQANCVKFVEQNIRKYSLKEIEARLCNYCKQEWRGQKRIWWSLGHQIKNSIR